MGRHETLVAIDPGYVTGVVVLDQKQYSVYEIHDLVELYDVLVEAYGIKWIVEQPSAKNKVSNMVCGAIELAAVLQSPVPKIVYQQATVAGVDIRMAMAALPGEPPKTYSAHVKDCFKHLAHYISRQGDEDDSKDS